MKRNTVIDFAKFVAAILVVAIHIHPFSDLSYELDFFVVHTLCRLAVPFFAVCTGFYITTAFDIDRNAKCMSPVWKSMRKVVKMYLGWSVLYFLIHLCDWYVADTLYREWVVGWCKSLFVSSSYFHLWYLTALIYALPLFALVLKNVHPRYYLIIAIPLWIYKAITYGYIQFIPEWLKPLFSASCPIEALQTGIIFMLPLLLLGAWLAKLNLNDVSAKKMELLCLLFFVLLVVEVYNLRWMGGVRYSFIFVTFPLAAALFAYLYQTGKNVNFQSKPFAQVSMVIYCLHPAVLWLLKGHVNNSFFLFLSVSIISIVLSFFWYYFKGAPISFKQKC